jgi:hypothetical protein
MGGIAFAMRGRRAVALALLAVALGAMLSFAATGASGKTSGPSSPKCDRLSTRKLAKLVHQPKLYLDHVSVRDLMCTYYGVPKKIADNPPAAVAFNKIKYYPSLMISVLPGTQGEYDSQLALFKAQGLVPVPISRKFGLGRDARAFHQVITSAILQPCDPAILYNNWVGPPDCNPQPSLEQVTVLVYHDGLLVQVGAASQTPPTHLTEHNVETIAAGIFTGKLP